IYADTPASAAEVAAQLNREGFRTAGHRSRTGKPARPGKEWTRVAVLKVLANRRYPGEARWGEATRAKFHHVSRDGMAKTPDKAARQGMQKRRKLKHLPLRVNPPEGVVVVPGAHPAIVSPETFARAQAKRLSMYRKWTSPRGLVLAAPLSGLAHCGDC